MLLFLVHTPTHTNMLSLSHGQTSNKHYYMHKNVVLKEFANQALEKCGHNTTAQNGG